MYMADRNGGAESYQSLKRYTWTLLGETVRTHVAALASSRIAARSHESRIRSAKSQRRVKTQRRNETRAHGKRAASFGERI